MSIESLPPLESFRLLKWHQSDQAAKTYRIILRAEGHANLNGSANDFTSARVVGFLDLEFLNLHDILGYRASSRVVHEVISLPQKATRNQSDVVFPVGKRYRDHLIRSFKTWTGSYLPPSLHPLRPSHDDLVRKIRDFLDLSGKNDRTAREKVPTRENLRCAITGVFDMVSYNARGADLRRANEPFRTLPLTLEVSHILSHSTTQWDDGAKTRQKPYRSASVMAILTKLGFGDLSGRLQEVHSLWNILTLEHNLHQQFDMLNIWPKGTKGPNEYIVDYYDEHIEDFIRRNNVHNLNPGTSPIVLRFSSDLGDTPPHNPTLLTLHAVCARVAHKSGVVRPIDDSELDFRQTSGSSTHLRDDVRSLLIAFISLIYNCWRALFKVWKLLYSELRGILIVLDYWREKYHCRHISELVVPSSITWQCQLMLLGICCKSRPTPGGPRI